MGRKSKKGNKRDDKFNDLTETEMLQLRLIAAIKEIAKLKDKVEYDSSILDDFLDIILESDKKIDGFQKKNREGHLKFMEKIIANSKKIKEQASIIQQQSSDIEELKRAVEVLKLAISV